MGASVGKAPLRFAENAKVGLEPGGRDPILQLLTPELLTSCNSCLACPFSTNEEFITENHRCNMYPLEILD